MTLALVVLNSSCESPDYNVIIKTIFGQFSILHCHLEIKWSTVLYRQCIEVHLSQNINIFLIDVSKGYFHFFSFRHEWLRISII